ncbi:MAG: uracil-DNA glycosylase family protein [Bacteroides sp.]|nr:uracil-DNA glycosylase family protein [Bacteroides sp.]
MIIEQHPLQPFLPANARLLMLGSFPPQQKRWSMEFYYPNWNNDMWRITGQIFFQDKEHFADNARKVFRKEQLIRFLQEKGIALYDTATAVCRLQDNASDKFLQIVQPTDVAALLHQLPHCQAIVTTGEKATETLCERFSIAAPRVGSFTPFVWEERTMRLYRMPSSSRAYPLALEKKAAFYRTMYQEIGML